MADPERVETVIVGAGQSGLSVGYFLARQGRSFVILDANPRIGDAWRNRWDSLRLFTPARFDGLAGMRFPAPRNSFPTKDEMADFLEEYAQRFALPVRTQARVTHLSRSNGSFLVEAGHARFEAKNVVVAMSNFQRRRVPEFARELAPDIVQFHSNDYRNPGQLRDGDVLLVGAGNSGAEIAIEVARSGRRTLMSGRDTGHVPFPIENPVILSLLVPVLFRVVFHRVLTLGTPLGRRVGMGQMSGRGAPLIRTRPKDLAAVGVARVPKVVGVRDGKPLLENGQSLAVSNVIWCTGFDPGFTWIDLPVFGLQGEPLHKRGIVAAEPGLYFMGLHFLYAMSSAMIQGASRDAAYIANDIARRSVM